MRVRARRDVHQLQVWLVLLLLRRLPLRLEDVHQERGASRTGPQGIDKRACAMGLVVAKPRISAEASASAVCYQTALQVGWLFAARFPVVLPLGARSAGCLPDGSIAAVPRALDAAPLHAALPFLWPPPGMPRVIQHVQSNRRLPAPLAQDLSSKRRHTFLPAPVGSAHVYVLTPTNVHPGDHARERAIRRPQLLRTCTCTATDNHNVRAHAMVGAARGVRRSAFSRTSSRFTSPNKRNLRGDSNSAARGERCQMHQVFRVPGVSAGWLPVSPSLTGTADARASSSGTPSLWQARLLRRHGQRLSDRRASRGHI
eukprot:3600442-Pleurochrysis_carterae.AAC.3